MTSKRNSMVGHGTGVEELDRLGGTDDLFSSRDEVQQEQDSISVNKYSSKQTKRPAETDVERATFYIRPDQSTQLEEIKIQLKKRGIKSDKSSLVRMAIDLLSEQEIEELAKRFTCKQL